MESPKEQTKQKQLPKTIKSSYGPTPTNKEKDRKQTLWIQTAQQNIIPKIISLSVVCLKIQEYLSSQNDQYNSMEQASL